MKTNILKKIFLAFVISLICSVVLSYSNYESTPGNDFRQMNFVLVILNVILCCINFILALPALLNVYDKIVNNWKLSFFSFFSLPVLFFAILFGTLFDGGWSAGNVMDFLILFMPSISFGIALSVQFYNFRQEIKGNDDLISNE